MSDTQRRSRVTPDYADVIRAVVQELTAARARVAAQANPVNGNAQRLLDAVERFVTERLDEGFAETFKLPRRSLEELSESLRAFGNPRSTDRDGLEAGIQLCRAFRWILAQSLGVVGANVGITIDSVYEDVIEVLRTYERAADQIATVYQSQLAATMAMEAAADAQQAAGSSADSGLAAYFDSYAIDERRRTMRLQLTGGSLIAACAAFTAYIVSRHDIAYEWAAVVSRVATTVPVLLFAAYLLREASQHRRVAITSGEAAVRLKTITAYTDRLSDHGRDELREEFGKQVFQRTEYPEPQDTKEIISLIDAVRELIGKIVPSK